MSAADRREMSGVNGVMPQWVSFGRDAAKIFAEPRQFQPPFFLKCLSSKKGASYFK